MGLLHRRRLVAPAVTLYTPTTLRLPYEDPLSLIWIDAAARLGIDVRRSGAVYASWDGQGILDIASAADMDPDDSVAQMILHEICHALVAGPDRHSQPDWGLDNTSSRDVLFEHAANRLQAALADRYGLRNFLATTTEFRAYYDALPQEPLGDDGDPAAAVARAGWERARTGTWGSVIESALRMTVELSNIMRPLRSSSLWSVAEPMHRAGFVQGSDPERRCGDCAWSRSAGRTLRCRQASGEGRNVAVRADEQGCRRWEPKLSEKDCGSCGACCREGFHVVPVAANETTRSKHPSLVRGAPGDWHIPRPTGACLALCGDGSESPFRCRIYEDRPRACVDFEVGGDACLIARRRVGLSK